MPILDALRSVVLRPAREAPPAPANDALPPGVREVNGRYFAADGLEVNAPRAPATRSLSRREMIARAKKADVPQRVQEGPTCGLYALGMVFDFWHGKDAANAAPLVRDSDVNRGASHNHTPTTDERILDVAQDEGYTALGEMFTGRQLAKTAAHFGYTASIHEDATLDDLYRLLDAGRPALVAFDVDRNGNPGNFGGQRAHYAVIQGYFDDGGERYLVAKHGWGVQSDHVWRASDFDESWKALKTTDFYGVPGDGVIPGHREREPSELDLPDVGRGRAGIERSLATKIIEVVPQGETPTGGDLVAA